MVPPMSAEREFLIPVLVDATGRSGTTAMMRLLASSDAVAVEREYPYESRYLTYLYSWTRMLDGDAKAAGKWPRERTMHGPVDEIGGLPWRDLLPDASRFADSCFRSAWKHFTDITSDGTTHYIEKVSRWMSEAAPSVLPATRVIYLVRDPRDVWLSTAAFNSKRGFFGFGRKPDQKEEEFLANFITTFRRRHEPLLGRKFGGDQMLVRYEDFMSDTGAVAAKLGNWLGLEFDPNVVSERIGKHVTSGSAAASTGRWRKEMPKRMVHQFESELGDVLDGFGYR
jgi:hypothetical protein